MKSSILKERIKKIKLRNYVIYICFLLLLLVFAIILRDTQFLSVNNIMNILRQTAMISVMAVGMTFVISAGEIDLSIGSIVALSAMCSAKVVDMTNNIFLAFLSALAIGIIFGGLNGLLITKVRIPSFLVTMGTEGIALGLARIVTDLQAVSIVNSKYNFIFGSGSVGIVSILFIWTIVITFIGYILYNKTSFGRSVLAVGGNRAAARYSGVKTDKIRIIVMMISGITASIAACLYTGRLHGARYTLGEDDVMNVIAAVVIGGTSFSGGKGTIIGALFGSIIMGMLNNGLLLVGLSVSEQMIARGIIIILAVSLSLREKKSV
ncbi:MAG: ABC transporter permease [Hespellia sp.]|nr:ABC transporter permease [Hespellia sp.]